MEFKPLFYACLLLCAIVFFHVLLTVRKNMLLKVCFLLIISSLFVMNFFSYVGVETRLQFVLVKSMRVVYACSTMVAIIQLVTRKIPRWIIAIVSLSVFFIIGLRIFNFDKIDLRESGNGVFSVGQELYNPIPAARIMVIIMAIFVTTMTYYYYRQFFMKMNKEDIYYKHLSRWLISMVLPFFLLIICGILGATGVFSESLCPYLFLFFSFTIIFSILFRPKVLDVSV